MFKMINSCSLEQNQNDKTRSKPVENRNIVPRKVNMLKYFEEYCNNTHLHGVRYLAEDRRHFIEKLFWLTALIFCAAGCALMIVKTKEKLENTPVIVTFEESATNIWHIPLPAVTICPFKIFRKTGLYAATDNSEMHEYKLWAQQIYLKMVWLLNTPIGELSGNREILHNELSMIQDNSTWVHWEYFFVRTFLPRVYNSYLKDTFTTMLKQMFENIRKDKAILHGSSCNATCAAEKFSEMESDLFFGKNSDEYYVEWKKENYEKTLALSFTCPEVFKKVLSMESANQNLSTGWQVDNADEARRFLAKVTSTPLLIQIRKDYGSEITTHLDDLSSGKIKYVWTEDGLCYPLNMVHETQLYRHSLDRLWPTTDEESIDWNPDTGYSRTAGPRTYPRRSLGVSPEDGFRLYLEQIVDDNTHYVCGKDALIGFKVILHRPDDVPQLRFHRVERILYGSDVSITIKPSLITTSPGLEKYDPHKRQCYFSHEKHLQFYKTYTKNNCELECLANATLNLCGCVAFYMPRNSTTKVCKLDDRYYRPSMVTCMDFAARQLEEDEIKQDLEEYAKGARLGSAVTECDCLPSCVTYDYEPDVNTLEKDVKKEDKKKEFSGRFDNNIRLYKSRINIFFKEKDFIARRRNELYGQIEFLANIGGLLGLFSGFSIISFIEILYYLSIRLWINFYRRWADRHRTYSIPDV